MTAGQWSVTSNESWSMISHVKWQLVNDQSRQMTAGQLSVTSNDTWSMISDVKSTAKGLIISTTLICAIIINDVCEV